MIIKYLHKSVIFAAISICLVLGPSHAGQRYGTPPPVVLSPDLTAPWMLQLRNAPPANRMALNYRPASVKKRTVKPFWQVKRRQTVQPVAAPHFSYLKKKPARTYRQQPGQLPGIRQIALRHDTRQRSDQPVRQKQTSKQEIDPRFLPQTVAYSTSKKPGTVVIDTNDKYLYLVLDNGMARRYGVGVGKPGFEWAGTHKITRKAEWPDWRPPAEMIAREKKKGRILPKFVEGGVKNPLGARALYLGSTLYRIHGTNQPWTIGKAVSSGCIRMRNEDVMDLYDRIGVGTRVIVS